jgi:hypothetical protein
MATEVLTVLESVVYKDIDHGDFEWAEMPRGPRIGPLLRGSGSPVPRHQAASLLLYYDA